MYVWWKQWVENDERLYSPFPLCMSKAVGLPYAFFTGHLPEGPKWEGKLQRLCTIFYVCCRQWQLFLWLLSLGGGTFLPSFVLWLLEGRKGERGWKRSPHMPDVSQGCFTDASAIPCPEEEQERSFAFDPNVWVSLSYVQIKLTWESHVIKHFHYSDRLHSVYRNLNGHWSQANLKLTWFHLSWHSDCILINDVTSEHTLRLPAYANKQP